MYISQTIVKRVVTLIRLYYFYGNHMDTKQIVFLAHLKPYWVGKQGFMKLY